MPLYDVRCAICGAIMEMIVPLDLLEIFDRGEAEGLPCCLECGGKLVRETAAPRVIWK